MPHFAVIVIYSSVILIKREMPEVMSSLRLGLQIGGNDSKTFEIMREVLEVFIIKLYNKLEI
ncbi:hypothetical protein C1H46_005648 [Malus baccata]|uniref:Uncharacterized protein n=1 Tax=Malus baccata TaxID=106549 RepID=A0A540NE61_MALBA|nr:hypothetical protein C1H46_005648 [Malus baccata]